MNILRILKKDLKNIRKNKVALGIIIGLCIIPSLYTWITLKANWNPYVDTGNVPVAVVNEDSGTIINNKIVNFGQKTVNELQNNKDMKWVFVGKKVADQGLKDGQFYSEIIIPSDFSEDLQTVFTGNPIKPDLIYRVNDKTNAIAAKISDLAVNQLQVQIKQTFFQSLNSVLLNYSNSLGKKIKSNEPLILNLKNIVGNANKDVANITGNINSSKNSVESLSNYLETLKNDIPNISNQIDNLQGVITSSKYLLKSTQNNIGNIESNSNNNITLMQNTNNSLNNFIQNLTNTIQTQEQINNSTLEASKDSINNAKSNINSANETANKTLNVAKQVSNDVNSIKLSKKQVMEDKKILDNAIGATKTIKSIIATETSLLNTLNSINPTPAINNLINVLNGLNSNINNQLNGLVEFTNYLTSQSTLSTNVLNTKLNGITAVGSAIVNDFNNLNNNYSTSINSFVTSMSNNLDGSLNSANNILQSSKEILPALQSIANMGISTSNLSVSKANELKDKLNGLEGTLDSLKVSTDKLTNNALNNLTKILDKNPNEFSKLFASPVGMKIEELYGMSIFGVGLAPFYTVLSIWVGALLCTTMISTVDRKEKNITKKRALEIHFAKMLLFLIINFIQATIVTIGDIVVIGIHPANFWLLMGFAWLSGLVFTVIIFTLVSLNGNFGKAAALAIMVVQVAGSAAIYPIQVNPEFFQKLEPFWPFTYAIDGFRQAIGSPDAGQVLTDIKFLLLFLLIFILLGFGRMFIYPMAEWVEKQFNQSKL